MSTSRLNSSVPSAFTVKPSSVRKEIASAPLSSKRWLWMLTIETAYTNGLRRCVPSLRMRGETPFAPSFTRNPVPVAASFAPPGARMSSPVSSVTTPTCPGLMVMSS